MPIIWTVRGRIPENDGVEDVYHITYRPYSLRIKMIVLIDTDYYYPYNLRHSDVARICFGGGGLKHRNLTF